MRYRLRKRWAWSRVIWNENWLWIEDGRRWSTNWSAAWLLRPLNRRRLEYQRRRQYLLVLVQQVMESILSLTILSGRVFSIPGIFLIIVIINGLLLWDDNLTFLEHLLHPRRLLDLELGLEVSFYHLVHIILRSTRLLWKLRIVNVKVII